MRSLFAFSLALAILLLAFKDSLSGRSSDSAEPREVSIVGLLASPQDYNGRFIRTTGFLCIEFEGNALYLHEEDYRYSMTKNAVKLDLSKEQEDHFKDLSLKHVLIEGTIEASKQSAERGMYTGSLKNITRLETWPPIGRR
jgi:hypothetical protein